MDSSKVHLFDPATTRNMTVDPDHAGRIPGHEDSALAGTAGPED
jgi:hypothetical protein